MPAQCSASHAAYAQPARESVRERERGRQQGVCQGRITANFLFVLCVFCVGVRKFLIAALTGSGQMAFGFATPPASLCKCQQSACCCCYCCCPATALCTHKKYVFFTLPFIFAHNKRRQAREKGGKSGSGGEGETLQDVLELVAF